MIRFARSATNKNYEVSYSTAQGTPQQEYSTTAERVGDQVCYAQFTTYSTVLHKWSFLFPWSTTTLLNPTEPIFGMCLETRPGVSTIRNILSENDRKTIFRVSSEIKPHCSLFVLTRWCRNLSIVPSPSGDTIVSTLVRCQTTLVTNYINSI